MKREEAAEGTYGGSQRQAGQISENEFGTSFQLPSKPDMVWVKTGNAIHPVKVKVGAGDGTNDQIMSGLKLGDVVVISMMKGGNSETTSETRSPFMPQRRSRT